MTAHALHPNRIESNINPMLRTYKLVMCSEIARTDSVTVGLAILCSLQHLPISHRLAGWIECVRVCDAVSIEN